MCTWILQVNVLHTKIGQLKHNDIFAGGFSEICSEITDVFWVMALSSILLRVFVKENNIYIVMRLKWCAVRLKLFLRKGSERVFCV